MQSPPAPYRTGRLRRSFAAAVVTLLLLGGRAVAQDEIFSDDFETGDTSRWSRTVPPPPVQISCLGNAPLPSTLRAGDLGPAPTGGFDRLACVEVRNDLPQSRLEVARSGVLLAAEDAVFDTDDLVLVAGEGTTARRVAAQFDALSRWGGPRADTALPIRWLAVAVQAELPAADLSDPNSPVDAIAGFELRRYTATPAAPADTLQLVASDAGGGALQFDNGVARFVFDPTSASLLRTVDLLPSSGDLPANRRVVDATPPGALGGPRVTVVGGALGGGDLLLDATVAGAVQLDMPLDPVGFEAVDCGPLLCQMVGRGHLIAPQGETVCTSGGAPGYESLGYTVVFTLLRGERAVEVDWVLRNECSDGFGGSWTDDVRSWRESGWSIPLVGHATQVSHGRGTSLWSSPAAFTGTTRVEQIEGTGAGTNWTRRALVRRGASDLETAVSFERPLLALETDGVLTSAHTAWTRFREPIGMRLVDDRLDLLTVAGDGPLLVGEGKGLWNRARVQWDVVPGSGVAPLMTAVADSASARTERALGVRSALADLNRAEALPSLGEDRPSTVRDVYRDALVDLHEQTVDGQWAQVSTYGTQLWPDTQFDQALPATGPPSDNSVVHDYWNSAYAETVEFLRSGEPRWLWDFALPQIWLQLHTAYLNTGSYRGNNRNGAAVTSGGQGAGQWHRSAFGSDDYTYNRGMHLGYALHPTPLVRDRFAEQGRMVFDRYSLPAALEDTRDFFLQRITFERQQMQHFENLANCAEFARAPDGAACHQRLVEIVTELATDNLAAGVLCQGDPAPDPAMGDTCFTPQQFMQNAMMYGFLQRLWRSYRSTLPTAVADALRRALVRAPEVYYQQGMSRTGAAIDLGGAWAAILDCTLNAAGTEVGTCSYVQNGDGDLLFESKPQTLALLLMAGALDAGTGLCGPASTAFEDPAIATFLASWSGSGWWKGAAQMMQNMAFGVGAWEQCNPAP